jgi:hypothetical protein
MRYHYCYLFDGEPQSIYLEAGVSFTKLSGHRYTIPAAVEDAAEHITLAVQYEDVAYTPAEYTLLMIRPFAQYVTGQSFSELEQQSAGGLKLMTQRWSWTVPKVS